MKPDFGVGVEFRDGSGVDFVTVLERPPRTVVCSITSFRGVSAGAKHWYCTLKVDALGCRVLNVPQPLSRVYRLGSVVQFSGAVDPSVPEGARAMRIEVQRKVTGRDRRTGHFDGYAPGSTTNRWESYEAARKAGERLFRQMFAKGWRLVADRWNDSYKDV